MDVSVIIVSYNTCELTRNCISSVIDKTKGVEYEIIVVDNASSDGSPEMIKTTFPQVKLVEEKNNWGFGKANNLGAEYASGDYLFLLNSDTILVNNAIKILHDYIKINPKIGICGGQLLDEKENIIDSCDSYSTFFEEIFIALFPAAWLKSKAIQYSTARSINGFVYGADMMIKKQYFEQLKGFDPDFFMYDEDKELSLRFKKVGYLTCFVPDAKIIHLAGQSGNANNVSDNYNIDKWSYSETRYSRFLYLRKRYGHHFARLIYLICYIKGKAAMFFFFFSENKIKKIYWKKYCFIHKKQYQRYLQQHKAYV